MARFELAAFPAMLDAARRNAAGVSVAMMAYTGPEVATLMADWFTRLKAARTVALAWLTRHPRSAARALVPAALGRPGTARRNAELALRAIAGAGHGDTVLAGAGAYGDAARTGIETLLAIDPVDVIPDRMPKVPEWASAALSPAIELRGGRGALPTATAQHVITMLAISKRGEPYAGLAVVQEACEPDPAEFAWGVFQTWLSAAAPSKENWAFDALGVIGDDEVVRRLAPLIRAWPGEGGHARADRHRPRHPRDHRHRRGAHAPQRHRAEGEVPRPQGQGQREGGRGRRGARGLRPTNSPTGSSPSSGSTRTAPSRWTTARASSSSASTSSSSPSSPTRPASGAKTCPSPRPRTTPSWTRGAAPVRRAQEGRPHRRHRPDPAPRTVDDHRALDRLEVHVLQLDLHDLTVTQSEIERRIHAAAHLIALGAGLVLSGFQISPLTIWQQRPREIPYSAASFDCCSPAATRSRNVLTISHVRIWLCGLCCGRLSLSQAAINAFSASSSTRVSNFFLEPVRFSMPAMGLTAIRETPPVFHLTARLKTELSNS